MNKSHQNIKEEILFFKKIMTIISPKNNGYQNHYRGDSEEVALRNREIGEKTLIEKYKEAMNV